MDNKLLSIVITAFNEEEYLNRCIDDDIAKAHAEMWLTKSLNHELMLRDVEQHSDFQFFHNYVNVEQSFAYSLTALGFLNFEYAPAIPR